jgi:hypothetical protein
VLKAAAEPRDEGGSAHEELLSRLEAIRSRIPPEDLLPESGPFVNAEVERIHEWFREALQYTYR